MKYLILVKIICIMKKIIVFLIAAMSLMCVQAQDYDDIYNTQRDVVTKQEAKQEKKRLKHLNDSVAFNRAVRALENSHWVLMADRVTLGRMAYTLHNVTGNSNFVLQQADRTIVQVAFNVVDPGPNGIGGVTLEGRTSRAEMKTDKKGNVYCTIHVNGTQLMGDVYVTLFAGGNRAEARFDPSFGYGRLTIYGELLPYDHSRH